MDKLTPDEMANLDYELFEDINDPQREPALLRDLLPIIMRRLGYKYQKDFAAAIDTDASNYTKWLKGTVIPDPVSLDRIVMLAREQGYKLSFAALYDAAVYTKERQQALADPDAYFVGLGRQINRYPPHVRAALVSAVAAQWAAILAVYERPSDTTERRSEWYYGPPSED